MSTPHPLDINSTSTRHPLDNYLISTGHPHEIQLKSTWHPFNDRFTTNWLRIHNPWFDVGFVVKLNSLIGILFSTWLFWSCNMEQQWVEFDTPLFHITRAKQPRVNIYVHSPSTPHPLDVHLTSTRRPLNIHSTFNWHPLDIHWTSSWDPIKIHLTSI